jgi:hypothetical protein
MVVTESAPEVDADRDAYRVDRDVQQRALSSRDEVLVDLVADGVRDPEAERQVDAPGCSEEQEPQHRELGRMRELPQREIPTAEAGAEIRDRGEDEDQARPRQHRGPPVDR